MTRPDLDHALSQYRAGLEAELALLHRLEGLPTSDQDTTSTAGVARLAAVADERERVMAGLVSLEHDLRPLRATLVEARTVLRGTPAFEEVAALHREAGDLVARILAADSHSLELLREAELARRFAADAVEKGENTLAAYRRVVAPPLEGARIVNRRG